jgi:hypothetical protein
MTDFVSSPDVANSGQSLLELVEALQKIQENNFDMYRRSKELHEKYHGLEAMAAVIDRIDEHQKTNHERSLEMQDRLEHWIDRIKEG